MEPGLRIPIVIGIPDSTNKHLPDSEFHMQNLPDSDFYEQTSVRFRIPQAKNCQIPNFTSKNLPDYGIRATLDGAISQLMKPTPTDAALIFPLHRLIVLSISSRLLW